MTSMYGSLIYKLENIKGWILLFNNELYIKLLNEEIEQKGVVKLTVHGNSMFPILKNGDLVTIEKGNQYNLGDVVAYFMVVDDKLKIIVHRIVLKRRDYLLTKGDNNNFIDNIKVKNTMVLGVALL